MKKGQTILIKAGAGAVGGFAIQFERLADFHIITTCSPGNNEHVKQLGAHKVIDYNTQNVVEEVHRLRMAVAWISQWIWLVRKLQQTRLITLLSMVICYVQWSLPIFLTMI
ncbi:hypothetical protein ACE1TI_09325 [Alteribacillus sp. JSM 102045]|uniref:hypothetical protein n=1 Tax=Alteribacillus sp. JSM 102045 TaxID=1562101 RepID=UPI0035C08BB0